MIHICLHIQMFIYLNAINSMYLSLLICKINVHTKNLFKVCVCIYKYTSWKKTSFPEGKKNLFAEKTKILVVPLWIEYVTGLLFPGISDSWICKKLGMALKAVVSLPHVSDSEEKNIHTPSNL